MLDITKDEIFKYAQENKVEYISDPTNNDTSLTTTDGVPVAIISDSVCPSNKAIDAVAFSSGPLH